MLELAYDAFYRRDYERMLERGNQARALAEQLDDRPLRAAGAAVIAMALTFRDHVEEAQALREEAAGIVDALSDEELAARIDAAASLGNAETYLGHLEDAVRHLERGLAVARATGQGKLFPLLTQRKAFALALLGRLAEAEDVAERAVEAARLSASPEAVAWALLNRAWTALLAGDLDTALRAGEESVELGRAFDDSPVQIWSACAYGSALLEAGEPARCLEILVPAAGGPDLPPSPGCCAPCSRSAWRSPGWPPATRAKPSSPPGGRRRGRRSSASTSGPRWRSAPARRWRSPPATPTGPWRPRSSRPARPTRSAHAWRRREHGRWPAGPCSRRAIATGPPPSSSARPRSSTPAAPFAPARRPSASSAGSGGATPASASPAGATARGSPP